MKVKYASFISIGGFILLWWLISASGMISPRFLPSPGSVIISLYGMIWEPFASVTLQGHIWASIQRFFVAFVVATGIAIPLGAWMGWNEKVNAVVDPVFEVLRFIPPIAWVPFAILWFRLGLKSECFIIAIGIFVPSLVNSRAGIRFVDPVLIQAAKTLGEIADPTAAPALAEALKDEEFDVRWLAAEGLIKMKTGGVEPLLHALMTEADLPRIREGAHHVIRELIKGELKEYLTPVLSAIEGVEPNIQVPWVVKTAHEKLTEAGIFRSHYRPSPKAKGD